MSSEAKRVKILTLVELLLGLALVVVGIVFVVMGAATVAPYVLCGEGALTLVFGVRGALIANVPAHIGKLVVKAVVALVVQIACIAAIVYLIGPENVGSDPIMPCAAAAPVVFSLAIALLSRGMAKRAER